MQQRLKEREIRVYDYGEIMTEDYENLDARIVKQLKTELLNNRFTDDAEMYAALICRQVRCRDAMHRVSTFSSRNFSLVRQGIHINRKTDPVTTKTS